MGSCAIGDRYGSGHPVLEAVSERKEVNAMEDDRWERGGSKDEAPAFVLDKSSVRFIDLVIHDPNVVAVLKRLGEGDGIEWIIRTIELAAKDEIRRHEPPAR
jgi:hypothetical protein